MYYKLNIEDTFYIKGRGQVVCILSRKNIFKVGWPITLCGPKGEVITTIIDGIDYVSMNIYGIWLKGFSEKTDINKWTAIIYPQLEDFS